MKPFRILVLSSFHAAAFRGYLENLGETPPIEAVDAGFGQALAQLAKGAPETPVDAAVVWTRAEDVSPAFRRLLGGDPAVAPADAVAEAATFARGLANFAASGPLVMVCTWALPRSIRGHGTMAETLALMNAELARVTCDDRRLLLLDTGRWLVTAGSAAWSERSWYLSKNPFGSEVHHLAAKDVRGIVAARMGAGRKLVIVDLDDTLWGGIVGDVGWNELRLGGHDAVGEAFVAFQHELLALKRRGILLAIASRNAEDVALEAIDSHPEMVLRRDDFVAWRIDWSDKAANIAALVRELNLGLQSAVFLDNSRIERERVREALPEVLVPEWPDDPLRYVEALRELEGLETGPRTDEDDSRTRLYAEERERELSRENVGSYDDWLGTLALRVRVEPLGPANRERVVQLFNKTNQLNLATRRLAETELEAWARGAGRSVLALRVADRFGDAGLTGILGLETADGTTRIVDWVLSCRVMGRKVEETLLAVAATHARAAGARALVAEFVPTTKNAPTLAFFERSGMRRQGNQFCWDLDREYPTPSQVQLEE